MSTESQTCISFKFEDRYLPMTGSMLKKVTVQVRRGDSPVAEKDTQGYPEPEALKWKPCKSPTYEPSRWELSKMWNCVHMFNHIRSRV